LKISRAEIEIGRLLYPNIDHWRPKTRADCENVPRPCPYVGCRHNLYLEEKKWSGSLHLAFPDLEPWDMQQSCALDIAEEGGLTLEQIGEILNITRERVRQIQLQALEEFRKLCNP